MTKYIISMVNSRTGSKTYYTGGLNMWISDIHCAYRYNSYNKASYDLHKKRKDIFGKEWILKDLNKDGKIRILKEWILKDLTGVQNGKEEI